MNSGTTSIANPIQKNNQDTCPICMDDFTNKTSLKRCKHSFCKECIDQAMKSKSVCPICQTVYGKLEGDQPKDASMKVTNYYTTLPGYEKYGTITIYYDVPSGRQGPEHPHPGKLYHGTTRTAYLPDSPEGKHVLSLLRRAFDQRLIFTIGTSSTTGLQDSVTWNDIHHKTSTHGGPNSYGYPDRDYLKRVQEELKAKGIF
ncbi:probable E3 ubiquitin-protein ligase DTX3 [Lethenteron reissneri]|uniref:probable E3 ubiquitin-protein ligase DTX3 n=1 Tax=Lethenteron reissneri TaxID=7753 RepID=UPI002AB6831B|nr:probable E3 ubiquitin-protein ligase DTX3 [Lethenteron reissneri]